MQVEGLNVLLSFVSHSTAFFELLSMNMAEENLYKSAVLLKQNFFSLLQKITLIIGQMLLLHSLVDYVTDTCQTIKYFILFES